MLAAREAHVLGKLWRLGAGCARRPDVRPCHPCADRGLRHQQGRCRPARLGHAVLRRVRRLARRRARRSLWPRQGAPDHGADLCARDLRLRIRDELHPAPGAQGDPGPRLRRRMGRRRRADGRDHPPRTSRQGARLGAERLGRRLGRGRAAVALVFTYAPAGYRLARPVRDRAVAGAAHHLHPPRLEGAAARCRSRRRRRSSPRSPASSIATCCARP